MSTGAEFLPSLVAQCLRLGPQRKVAPKPESKTHAIRGACDKPNPSNYIYKPRRFLTVICKVYRLG